MHGNRVWDQKSDTPRNVNEKLAEHEVGQVHISLFKFGSSYLNLSIGSNFK